MLPDNQPPDSQSAKPSNAASKPQLDAAFASQRRSSTRKRRQPCLASSFSGITSLVGWVGFDTRNGWRLVGVDSASPEPYPEEARTVAHLIAERIADHEHRAAVGFLMFFMSFLL
jgi:hypothetical protein